MPSDPFLENTDDFERLFLLEFLVDNVHFSNSTINLPPNIIESLGQTCVRFQFLNYPVLEVCEEDFCPSPTPRADADVSFKSGKSCLFSLRGPNTTQVQLPFDVFVTVLRKVEGRPADLIPIGKSVVNLSGSFTAVLNVANQSEISPVSKTLRDVYVLKNDGGQNVGTITVFIRLSCFGKLIVTQFQVGGLDNKSFLFKGVTDGRRKGSVSPLDPEKQLADIRPLGESIEGFQKMPQTPGGPSFGPGGQSFAPGGQSYGYGGQSFGPGYGFPPGGQGYGGGQYCPQCPMNQPMPGTGDQWGQGGLSTDPYYQSRPTAFDEGYASEDMKGQNYKEIGAEVNGHALNIKILRKQKKPKKQSSFPYCERIAMRAAEESEESIEEPPPPPPRPMFNLCDCDYPTPPSMLPPPPLPPIKHKKKKRSQPACPLEMPMGGQYCRKSDCPMGYPQPPGIGRKTKENFELPPGSVGLKGNQVIFQTNHANEGDVSERDRKQANSTFYKISSNDGNTEGQKNIIQVVPEENGGKPEQDEQNDVFVLKIGKKNMSSEQRAKLELELRTPKMKENKIQTQDNDTQYNLADCPPDDTKGGKKGGKAGKGGKGGKGGKKGKKK